MGLLLAVVVLQADRGDLKHAPKHRKPSRPSTRRVSRNRSLKCKEMEEEQRKQGGRGIARNAVGVDTALELGRS